MAKFSGKIGFVQTVETSPGVWTDKVTEKSYKGDLLKNYIRWSGSEKVNEDFNISNQVSIVADSYLLNNLAAMKYVYFSGTRWKINSISIERPRLIISLGDIYRGEEIPEEEEDNEQSSPGTA